MTGCAPAQHTSACTMPELAPYGNILSAPRDAPASCHLYLDVVVWLDNMQVIFAAARVYPPALFSHLDRRRKKPYLFKLIVGGCLKVVFFFFWGGGGAR